MKGGSVSVYPALTFFSLGIAEENADLGNVTTILTDRESYTVSCTICRRFIGIREHSDSMRRQSHSAPEMLR
jgi:hypothetical protein